jgi:hypothetical protein
VTRPRARRSLSWAIVTFTPHRGTRRSVIEHWNGSESSVELQLTEHFNGSKATVLPSESGDGARSVSGLAGGPLFAVGQGPGKESKTLILRQPAP